MAEDDAEARRLGTDYIEYYMKSTALFRPIGEHERAQMVFGGVETCIEKLRCLQDEGGVNYILGWMNFGGMPHDMVSRSMELFAEAVMPARPPLNRLLYAVTVTAASFTTRQTADFSDST